MSSEPKTWTVDTADALRSLTYRSPAAGWHSHGLTLVPTDGCAACAELRRRADPETHEDAPPPPRG